MARSADVIPTRPFQEWLERNVHGDVDGLAARLGWGVRRLFSYRTSEEAFLDRPAVEEALFRAGLHLWDIYPEEDFPELYEAFELFEAWCHQCGERRPVERTGACAFCGEDTGFTPETKKVSHHGGWNRKASEELLLEARRLYYGGMSLHAIARKLHAQTTYSTEEGFARALSGLFARRGWRRRPNGADQIIHGMTRRGRKQRGYQGYLARERGYRPIFCAGTTSKKEKGRGCRRFVKAEGDLCPFHDPARRVEFVGYLERARAA